MSFCDTQGDEQGKAKHPLRLQPQPVAQPHGRAGLMDPDLVELLEQSVGSMLGLK
jgi:hypothetical protein